MDKRMMSSRSQHDNDDSAEDSSSSQLLRDIEAISKALYLDRIPPKSLIPGSNGRSKSTGKTNLKESKSNLKPRISSENVLHKDKKSSPVWDWKKPLKALAHIRQQRFNVSFLLRVHSIEGLSANFKDLNLHVHWKRKDKELHTQPSIVLNGIAEFEETLMHKCSVYGSRSGPQNSAKYEVKLFLMYASVIGAPELDLGKHWVDLSRLLPLSLEELEGEKSSGKWTTSFKLSGRAKGAALNVSFGFSVMKDNSVESHGNIDASNLVNLTQPGLSKVEEDASFHPRTQPGLSKGEEDASYHRSKATGMLQQIGSIPNNLNCKSSVASSVELKFSHQVLPNLGLELSKSINYLYQKLNEGNLHSSAGLDTFCDHAELLKAMPDPSFESAKSAIEREDVEFIVIEKGIEMSEQDQFRLEEPTGQVIDGSAIEIIEVDEILKDEGTILDEEIETNAKVNQYGSCIEEVVTNDDKYEDSELYFEQSIKEVMELAFNRQLISESSDMESPLVIREFLERKNYMEVKCNYKASIVSKRSLSLDDVIESTTNDFLNMLETVHHPSALASDSDPESPRELLLREFEEEAMVSGNFILDFDGKGEHDGFGSIAPTVSGFGDDSEDFDLSSLIQAVEDEHKSEGQLLRNRRKFKFLEDLETEVLMREWGLNEKMFQNSPRICSDGFGSPIELPPEEPVKLPPLEDGFGPFLQTKGGGYLRSMNPSLFRHSKNPGNLIIQVSAPVVLPAEMGSDIVEILKSLASVGIQKLSLQVNALLTLEDITGKTMQQVAKTSAPSALMLERKAILEHDSFLQQDLKDFGEGSSLPAGDIFLGYVSIEDVAPLAMDRIETLSIEGLRIQCGMSDKEAPSSIIPQSSDNTNDVARLIDLSISLDEWFRLDAGIIGDDGQINVHTLKVLTAHHAKCSVGGTLMNHVKWDESTVRKHGLLGNNLTVALMVLLRDPLRNYEPVGASMLALIQVERVFLPLKSKTCNMLSERKEEQDCERIVKDETCYRRNGCEGREETGTPWFRITDVHLAGLNTEPGGKQAWGTRMQQLSGTRWLLASGMGNASRLPISKSKAIIRSYPQATRYEQTEDVFWSITTDSQNTGTYGKESAALIPIIRNPNVIFPRENTCKS